jgi:hypothetical protein
MTEKKRCEDAPHSKGTSCEITATRFLFRESFGSAHASSRRFHHGMPSDDTPVRLQIRNHRERQQREYVTHGYLPLLVTNRLAREEIVRILE